jgi:hypothetical protein
MNTEKLHKILKECTIQLRKGEIAHGTPELVEAINAGKTKDLPGGVVSIDMMPPITAVRPDLVKVDCHFLVIGVDKIKAEEHRAELVEILNDWPDDSLACGPSYITVGGEIGDQGAAFQLFALGEALGLWEVITPGKLHVTGQQANAMAGQGFIMITGYHHA